LSAADVIQPRRAGISSPQQVQIARIGKSFQSRMIFSSGFPVLSNLVLGNLVLGMVLGMGTAGMGTAGKLKINTKAISYSPDRISGEIGILRSSALVKLDAVFTICLHRRTMTLLMTAKNF